MAKIYTINNKILTVNNKWGEMYEEPTPVDPYNPLGLPSNTIRVKFSSGYTPSMGDTQTLVDSTNNIWDIYKSSNNWMGFFMRDTDLLEVLGANTTNITNMYAMFHSCSSLTRVSLFDTSSVTNMSSMFQQCTTLTNLPLYNTSNVVDISNMMVMCYKVETGALALYQQASSQTNPPSSYSYTFMYCGSNTQTGRAELAQIPSSWGGEGA